MPHIAERVLEAAGVGGWDLDVVTGDMTWTGVTFRICEVDPPHAPSLADALALYPPEARPLVAASVQAAIDGGTPWEIETPIVTARGRHRWVRSWGLAVRENGRTVRVVGALQDTTERHEQNARTERLSVVAAQMTNIVITTDRSGRIEWVNGALTRMTGYTLAEAHGRKPGDLLQGPLTDPATIAVMARGIADGTGFDVEIVNYSKAGVSYWMAITCSPLRDAEGTVNGFIGVQSDISARRAAEDTARAEAAERGRAEALLQDVLDALPNAITAYDSNDRLVMSNRRYAEMFPITARFAVPGRPHAEIIRLATEHGQYIDAPTEQPARDAWVAELLGYFHDGTAHELRLPNGRIAEVRESRSQTGNRVTVRTDITDLKHAEARASREAAERARADALLRDVVNTVPSAIVAYDHDERLVVTNPADAERASLPPAFSALGERLEDVMWLAVGHGYFLDAPAAAAEHGAWIAQLLAYLRDPAGAPRAMRLNDGRTVQVSARRSENGNLVIVRTDITALVRAQALLRDVVDAVPSAIVAYDPDDRVILANQAFSETAPMLAPVNGLTMRLADVLRLAAEEGYYADAPAAPAARNAWLAELLAYFRAAAGVPRTLRVNDGRSVQVRARRSPTGNLVVIRTDITDLLRTQALLHDVLEAIPSAIVAYDSDERVILANHALTEMAPMLADVGALRLRHADVLRLGADKGYFADLPAAPTEQDVWLADLLAYFRTAGGVPRTLRVGAGHSVQVRARRSASGNLVVVSTDITDLLSAQAMLRDVLDAIPNSVAAYDAEGRLILCNPAYMAMFPVSAKMATPGRRYEDIVRFAVGQEIYPQAGETPAAREAWIAEQVSHHRTPGEVRRLHMADGRVLLARERLSDSGNLVSVRTDITDLTRTEAMLRDILETLPSAVIAYDRDERLVLWNRAAVELLPESAAFAAVGRTLEEMVRFSATSGAYLDAGATDADHDRWIAARLAAYRASSGSRTLRLQDGRFLTALERRSESGNLVCVRTDTTDLKRAEEHLRWQAERDPLTLLHNRAFFLTTLDRALAATAGGTPVGGVLLLLDIDYFKQINDTLGHDMGDALLVEIAHRLRLYLRGGGEGAARLGGDEFGVVIPGLTDPTAVMARIDGLHGALSAPADLGGRRTPLGISMGATMFPAEGKEATKLLKNADLALYEAKRHGRGRWTPFRPEQATALERQVRMADALRDALARRQFTVALQPKRRLRDGAHAGFEALARWHDGTGWVSPDAFIPVAEETGLIRPLGRVVMAAALARVRDIRDRGFDPGRVALNVTGPQLLDPHFREQTLAALRRQGLAPAGLELELTGTALFGRASEQIDAVLRDVSGLGITLSLDDFGTGYASLAHLSRLPIDRLKIDRSFVTGIGRAGPGGVIARTVVSLAHSLGMESIAKGVETDEQMAFLADAGCDVAQGYLIARPMLTTDEAVAYLRAQAPPATVNGISLQA